MRRTAKGFGFVKNSYSSHLSRDVAVSIVVPVHNGESYLLRLVESLRAQTFDNFEILAIDDHSTDQSMTLLSKLADDEPRLRVFQTPHNLGTAPRVVNFALPMVTGVHFLYSSQDDFFSPDWLESMVTRSRETGADAVIPEMTYFHGTEADRTLSGMDGDREVILGNREAVEASLSWRIPGCALWKTDDVRRVGWSDRTFDGDELTVRMLYHAANTVAFSGGMYYYNQTNENAITKVRHPRQLQSIATALELRGFLKANGYDSEVYNNYIYRASLQFFRLAVLFRQSNTQVDPLTCTLVDEALKQLASADLRHDLQMCATGRGRLASFAVSHGSPFFRRTTQVAAWLPSVRR